jgi:hypothetical protein
MAYTHHDRLTALDTRFSYAGTLSWGFSADWDLVPDLHDLVAATDRAFADLRRAAGVAPG